MPKLDSDLKDKFTIKEEGTKVVAKFKLQNVKIKNIQYLAIGITFVFALKRIFYELSTEFKNK